MIKTISLKLAEQLKESGFPQDAEYKWIRLKGQAIFKLVQGDVGNYDGQLCWNAPIGQGMLFLEEAYAAPTAEEILEQLPKETYMLGFIKSKWRLFPWEAVSDMNNHSF